MNTEDSDQIELADHVNKPSVHHEGDGQIEINTSTTRVKVTEDDVVVIRNGAEHTGLQVDEYESLEFHFDRDEIISDRSVGAEAQPSRFEIVHVACD